MRGEPLRVLHGPTNVGCNPFGLAEAERALGLASWAVVTEEGPFKYPIDEVLFAPGDGFARQEAKRVGLLARALRDFDVVHFNFGRTLLPMRYSLYGGSRDRFRNPLAFRAADAYLRLVQMRDLPLLKAAGKALFVTYQGDDARQGDFCRANFPISHVDEVEPGYYSPEGDAAKRQAIATIARHVDGVYGLNPDLMHVLPAHAKFMPYASVDPAAWTPAPAANAVPLVLHAPSHRGVKGTPHVLAAVERLRAEGVAFEFRLVENLPHAEARRLYAQADLVIDQLLIGWYGALAVEAMALGKPVVCYLRDEDLGFIPAEMRAELPLIRATPTSIEAVLREWLTTRRGELAARGMASRGFVERWHDPRRIAEGLKADYEAAVAKIRRA